MRFGSVPLTWTYFSWQPIVVTLIGEARAGAREQIQRSLALVVWCA